MPTAIMTAANAYLKENDLAGQPAKPLKRDGRATFAVIDTALSSLGLNGAITVKKATRDLLYADLTAAADTLAVVYNDGDQALNGIYAKVGVANTGSWAITPLALPATFAADLAAVLEQTADIEGAVAATAQAVVDAQVLAFANLWPDAFFAETGGDEDALCGDNRIYSFVFDNRTWDPDLKHSYGQGGWVFDGGVSDAQGYDFAFDMPGVAEYGLTPGDTISSLLGVTSADAPDVITRMQFYSAKDEVGYTLIGSSISGAFVEALNGEAWLKIEAAEVPATAIGVVVWADKLSTMTDFAVFSIDVVKGDTAPSRPVVRQTPEALRRQVQPLIDTAVDGIAADLSGLPGNRATATARLATPLSDYGVPYGLTWMPERLQMALVHLRMLERGMGGVCRIALFGDSWLDNPNYCTRMFTDWITARYGDGGPGWMGFGYQAGPSNYAGNARDIYTVTSSGTSTSDYGGSAANDSPGLSNWKSSTAGAKVTVTAAQAGSGVLTRKPTAILSSAVVYWKGTSNGVVRYRWNGGSWTSFNTQGTVGDNNWTALSGLPTAAVWTLEVEVVSGSVELHGLYAEAASGVVVSAFAASGAKASDFVAANETKWGASLAHMGLHAALVMFGTNESVAGVSASTYAANVDELAERLRAAIPGGDLILAVPPQNATGGSASLADYRLALEPVAEARYAVLTDYQRVFGEAVADYDGTVPARDWMNDANHPVWSDGTGTAAPVLADALIRLFDIGGDKRPEVYTLDNLPSPAVKGRRIMVDFGGTPAVLVEAVANGTGWDYREYLLDLDSVDAVLTGTTSETTLKTVTIPARMMGARGSVRIGTLSGSTGSASKLVFHRFGGQQVRAIGMTTELSLQTETFISNRNNEASQIAHRYSTQQIYAAVSLAATPQTVDTTAAVSITITASLTNAGDSITLHRTAVWVQRKD